MGRVDTHTNKGPFELILRTIFHMCANPNLKIENEMIQILIDEFLHRKEDIKEILDISNSKGGYALNHLGQPSFQKLQNAILKQRLSKT